MEKWIMSKKDLQRTKVMALLEQGAIGKAEAALQLNLCIRQVSRIFKSYQQDPIQGIRRKEKKTKAPKTHNSELKADVLQRIATEYRDFGPTLISEYLKKRNGKSVLYSIL